MSVFRISLKGRSPLVLHNNQCVDPLHPLTKEIKSITGKRKKVDADHLELRRLEFIAGLYINQDLGPYIPNQNLRKMLIEGARKSKNGKQFESGIFVFDHAKIEYDGPRDVEGMLADGRFSWTTPAGNQSSTIMRTRPRFDKWSCEFSVETDESLVHKEMIEDALVHASRIGVCDARSIGYGRFDFEILK